MILPSRQLQGLRDGTITLAFRRWRRPTVRAGGTLLTAVGQLDILSVAPVAAGAITEADARSAGFDSPDALWRELDRRPQGDVYRIELGRLRPDPRIALRERHLTPADWDDLRPRLERLDARATAGAWVLPTLDVIAAHPGVRAGDLCATVGLATPAFKVNVRKLKALGLTESLEVGYRLSPRGVAARDRLRREAPSRHASPAG